MSKDYENYVWHNLYHHLPTISKIYFKAVLIQWSNYHHIISFTVVTYGSCDRDDVMVDYELLNLVCYGELIGIYVIFSGGKL